MIKHYYQQLIELEHDFNKIEKEMRRDNPTVAELSYESRLKRMQDTRIVLLRNLRSVISSELRRLGDE